MMPHRKRLLSGQVLYFHYPPPFTKLDTVASSRRLSPPFSRAPHYMCSLYYYWWAFLRLNDDYKACCESGGEGPMAALYADFGDVREDNFMRWWIDGGRLLFCEPPEDSIKVMIEPPRDHDDENRVLISIPLNVDGDRVLAEIEKTLGVRRSRLHKDEMLVSKARYSPKRGARLQALYRQLEIYKGRKENPNRDYHDLACLCGMAEKDRRPMSPESLQSSVSRYYAEACKLVKNVGEGRFLDDSEPDEEPDLFG